jgi:hypothetical protein
MQSLRFPLPSNSKAGPNRMVRAFFLVLMPIPEGYKEDKNKKRNFFQFGGNFSYFEVTNYTHKRWCYFLPKLDTKLVFSKQQQVSPSHPPMVRVFFVLNFIIQGSI